MNPAGVLVVDKPRGVTSRKAAAAAGRLAGASKCGHAGALDPLATGVLVVCLDRATLLSGFLAGGTKEYLVTALLGRETDTYDTDGEVLEERNASGLRREEVEDILGDFTGELEQLPPPYSAVKYKGKPLYYYARAGVGVEPRPRSVKIESVELVSLEFDGVVARLKLEVTCGPGTYVRSLVHDIGARTGTGACVAELRRVRSGDFGLDRSVALDRLESRDIGIEGAIMTMEDATAVWPTVTVDAETALAVSQGKPMLGSWIDGLPDPGGDHLAFRVLNASGRLLALYGPPRPGDEKEIVARPVRVIRPVTLEAGEDEAA